MESDLLPRSKNTTQNIPSIEEIDRKTIVFDYLNRLIPVLIGIFVFFNSFPHTTAIKEITLYLALLFVIVLAIAKKTKFTLKTPLTIPFLLFLIWSAAGIFFTANQPNTIHDILKHYIKYLVVFFILVNFYQTERQFKILVWIIALSSALFSIGGMVFFYEMEGHPLSVRFGFKEMSINYLGFVTIPGIVLMLGLIVSAGGLPEKVLLSLAFIWTVLSTLLTQTRGTLIGLVSAVLFATWGRWKVFLLVGSFLLGFLFLSPVSMTQRHLFDMEKLLSNERISMNKLTMEIIKDHPVVGVGFGMQFYQDREMLLKYNERVPEKYRQPPENIVPSPHNTYLDIAMRTGWVGFCLFLYVIAVFFKMAWQTAVRGATDFARTWVLLLAACMVSYLAQAFFADATFGPQAITFYIILALMTIVWKRTLQKNGATPTPVTGAGETPETPPAQSNI
jgi:putative inorganic carbon (HCO3(-)) transporter